MHLILIQWHHTYHHMGAIRVLHDAVGVGGGKISHKKALRKALHFVFHDGNDNEPYLITPTLCKVCLIYRYIDLDWFVNNFPRFRTGRNILFHGTC